MKRSPKGRFAFLRWAASIAIAWPILSGALFPPTDTSGYFVHDGTRLYFVPPGSCFPRNPTAIELLGSRHRPYLPRPFTR